MKKILSVLVFIIVVCTATAAWAPPGGGAVQIRDRNSANKADVAQPNSNDVAATVYGLIVQSFLMGFDGATWDRLTVGDNDNDDLATTIQGLDVRSFGYMWDTVNDNWDRMTGFEIKLSAKDMYALLTYNANLFIVGDTWEDWTGSAAGDALDADATAPWVIGLNHFYDGTNYRRWQGITAADGLTYPTAPWTLSPIFLDNGATLDMAKSGAVGELEVTDVATRPGEDAGNDWRKVKKESVATYSPAKETTTDVGTAATTVLASKEVLDWPNWCVYLENDDGADPFTDADVQVSPDGSTWISLTWTACDALAAGSACVYCVTNAAYRYVRVQVAAADANQVDVDAWITSNTN